MRKLSVCVTGLLGLLLLLPQDAQGQKKEKKVEAEPATAQDYTALNQVKELEGRLLVIEPTGKTLTVRVEFKHLEPNLADKGKAGKKGDLNNQQYQNFLRQQQQFYREYDQILRIKNPAQQQQRMQQLWAKMQMQAAKANFKGAFPGAMPAKDAFKVVTTAKQYEFEAVGEVHVARFKLATEYDDKGNIKQYTADELKKLKDTLLPGYKAKFEDLEPGQLVKLYLVRPKPAAKDKDTKPAAKEERKDEKGETKPGDTVPNVAITPGPDNRPQVRMILIESDPDPSFLPKTKGEPKKKKKN